MANKKLDKPSIAETHPDLVKEWHPTKNGILTPFEITAGSGQKIWWLCSKNVAHVWQALVSNRVRGSGCPMCSNHQVCFEESIATKYPDLSSQVHPTKNKALIAKCISPADRKTMLWICSKNPTHFYKASPRTRCKQYDKGIKNSCPECSSLSMLYPELARQWHPIKNLPHTANTISIGSNFAARWICQRNPLHEWKQTVKSRTSASKKNVTGKSDCPICLDRIAILSNCLETTHPDITAEWDYEINNLLKINPKTITRTSRTKVGWKCHKGHTWNAVVRDRTQKNTKCPFCTGRKATLENCLSVTHPDIAAQWYPDKNGSLTPEQFSKGSEVKIWWQCQFAKTHVWEARIYSRTSGRECPFCSRWTIESIRLFVHSLIPYLASFSPAELYVLFQQQEGLLDTQGRGKAFIQALKTGKIPQEELHKFANNQHSLVDELIAQQDSTFDIPDNELLTEISEHVLSESDKIENLPIVEVRDTLTLLDSKFMSMADEETVDFFIKSAVAKIWRHIFLNEEEALSQLENYQDEGEYAKKVKRLFSEEYHGAITLKIPTGYCFHKPPNLMQRYTAYLVKTRKRIGNWSGTGAGKTLSAIIASRVINARLTIICCPNNVIANWKQHIKQTYPDSLIYLKKSIPQLVLSVSKSRYLILNYEFFQQANVEAKLKSLIGNHPIDFIVIDEIHYSKQRTPEKASKRKKIISAFLSEAENKNVNLHILGMSATPVINSLFEGKTLIELVTGVIHDDLQTRPTVSNCIALYKKFVIHGIRYIPNYSQQLRQTIQDIDCSALLPEIRQSKTRVELEAILTKAKIPFILKNLRPKTIVYTYYREGIEIILQNAIKLNGWKVGLFTGDNKDGLESFVKGDVDILLASNCVGTGIDGLQTICNRLIINCLPWTHAEFKQLIGRIYRQGQKESYVDVIIPLTFATIHGEKRSLCESRLNRIKFKKDISDAAVDGVIPEGHLRTPEQAYKDTMLWLKRLEQGKMKEIERPKISIPLNNDILYASLRCLSDLTQMNQQINCISSTQTHQRFSASPQEWRDYHATYQEARKEWDVVPYQEAIRWCKARPDIIIGDFGCGEAFLANELGNRIHSFDHVAINDKVIACDMAHTPLNNASLNAVIFSLSLMGTNFVDYLKEAYRCLTLDGHLWISEPTSRIQDIHLFHEFLERLGFDIRSTHEKGKFTFIEALKSERNINEIMLETLLAQDILKI